jgi:3-hydroxybutyryl-CoA dehydrogenase
VKVAVVGVGLMGSQIGCELALGGHAVQFVSRDPALARARVEEVLADAVATGIFTSTQADDAGTAMTYAASASPGFELAIESVPEDLALKIEILRGLAAAEPAAILASNTSSLRITALGTGVGAPARIVGMHYWNPPLLMPLVEVVPGAETDPAVVATVCRLLEQIGKQPVTVDKDVPGFVWNRLQFALLREAVWLVENGAASPETVDLVVREGLARRWRHVGPFEAVALGGHETWSRVGANLLPELSTATAIDGLLDKTPEADQRLAQLKLARNRGLADDLLGDRATPPDQI